MTTDRLSHQEDNQKNISEYRENPKRDRAAPTGRDRKLEQPQKKWSKYLYLLLGLGGIGLGLFVPDQC